MSGTLKRFVNSLTPSKFRKWKWNLFGAAFFSTVLGGRWWGGFFDWTGTGTGLPRPAACKSKYRCHTTRRSNNAVWASTQSYGWVPEWQKGAERTSVTLYFSTGELQINLSQINSACNLGLQASKCDSDKFKFSSIKFLTSLTWLSWWHRQTREVSLDPSSTIQLRV